MKKAPTSVMVLSIIGIVLGALGVCGMAWSLFVTFGPGMGPSPMFDAIKHDRVYLVVTGISAAIGIPLTILLIAASISGLKLAKWARSGMLIYAWIAILQCAVGMIFNLAYVMPKMMAAVPAGPGAAAGRTGGMIGGVCGGLLSFVYPACVLYFYTRPRVVDAFNGIFPAQPTGFPVMQQGGNQP